MACSSWLARLTACSACFLITPRITFPGVTPPIVHWAPHIYHQSRIYPIGIPTGQSGGGHFLNWGSLSQNDSSWHKTSPHTRKRNWPWSSKSNVYQLSQIFTHATIHYARTQKKNRQPQSQPQKQIHAFVFNAIIWERCNYLLQMGKLKHKTLKT